MLIIKASHLLQETVAVLSEPEHDAAMRALGNALRRVASCRTRQDSLRSELVIVLLVFVVDTNSAVTSSGQGFLQNRL